MSSVPPHRPSELGRSLLAAAREEQPPEASVERAYELVETDRGVAPTRVRERWILWALPAAAVLIGVVLVTALRPPEKNGATLTTPTPVPTVSPEPPLPIPTEVTASSAEIEIAQPSPSASASASPPSPVAVRPQPAPPPAAAPKAAGPSSPKAGAPCGCAAGDLMCQMRCSQKKK